MGHLRTVRRRISGEPVRRSLLRILRENVLFSIATVARRNRAHINTAYFCYSTDLDLYFLSDPGSLHAKNLATNSSAAATVFRSAQIWGKPDRGIQLFGTCREVTGREAQEAKRLYGERFPLYAAWLKGTSDEEKRLAAQLGSYRVYRFRPRSVKILDERVFGSGVFVVADVQRPRTSK